MAKEKDLFLKTSLSINGRAQIQRHKLDVTLSLAKGLRRKAAGFSPALACGASVTPFSRSHRHGILRENDIMFLMLGTPENPILAKTVQSYIAAYFDRIVCYTDGGIL
jgi:hypothetical protein